MPLFILVIFFFFIFNFDLKRDADICLFRRTALFFRAVLNKFKRILFCTWSRPPSVECEKNLQVCDCVTVRAERGVAQRNKMHRCDPEPPPPQSYWCHPGWRAAGRRREHTRQGALSTGGPSQRPPPSRCPLIARDKSRQTAIVCKLRSWLSAVRTA